MIAAIKKLMSKPTATRIKEICDWHNAVIAVENAYFAAAGAAMEDSRKAAQSRADQLATTLRDGTPTAEAWTALAETRQLLATMRELGGQAPFWSRRDITYRRESLHPEAKDTATELVTLARSFIEKPLADAIKEDLALTEKLEARESVVTRRQRELAEISDSITMTAVALSNGSDSPQWWAPLSGLIAGLDKEIAR